jgi:hypothetical protein
VREEEAVALGGDREVGVGLGALAEHVGLAQHLDDGDELDLVPPPRRGAAVPELGALLHGAEGPRLDRLRQDAVAPRVVHAHAVAGARGEGHALVEQALVALRRQVAHGQ